MNKLQNLYGENVFQKIVDNCFGNIFVVDGRGTIIYLSKSSADSLGYSQSELLGMSVSDLVDRKIVGKALSLTAIKEKRTVVDTVPCMETGKTLSVISNPVFDENGEVELVITYSQIGSKLNELIRTLEEKESNIKQTLSYLGQGNSERKDIIAESDKTKQIVKYIEKVATFDTTILLTGESGTGKEVFSRLIHNNSKRKDYPFIPVNCAAIPHELMESEFFGYESGAFTGANKQGKIGFFEMANKGTIFLDEIGELPLSLQTKLLRVLENGEVRRVGSSVSKKLDIRIVSATNRDLKTMVNDKSFRNDLYYRLNVIPISIPPLRERTEDIVPLANYFLNYYNRKNKEEKHFSDKMIKVFLKYEWPGNVRELRNVVERLVVTTSSDCIEGHLTLTEQNAFFESVNSQSEIFDHSYYGNLKDATSAFEKKYIESFLLKNDGKVSIAADELGIHRSALYKKIEKYNIHLEA